MEEHAAAHDHSSLRDESARNTGADLAKLVYFTGEEADLVSRMKEAVKWVASKPEGLAKLEEAYRLHGEPLEVIVSSSLPNIGYGDRLFRHAIYANPRLLEAMPFVSEGGETIPHTPERFIAHELAHAAQLDIPRGSDEKTKRLQIILQRIYTEILPTIPIRDYKHQIIAAKGDLAALGEVFGEIFDKHISPRAKAIERAFIEGAAQDEVIKAFVEKYEHPAIEFENSIMTKYKGEPAKTADYMHSVAFDGTLRPVDRDNFIALAIAPFKAAQEQDSGRARGAGGHNPKKPVQE